MSLRPKLHVSTFHWRTVVSMIGRLCHLFVHALSSLQVANAQCMTLRSLAPSLRAAREKHRFAAGKNIGTEKNTFGSRKKRPAAGKSYFRSGKNASKKCRFAAGKIQSSSKNTLQQHKSTFASEKMHFGGSGKKPSEAGKNQQQRKSSFATQKVAATEKIHFRNGKKQQPSNSGFGKPSQNRLRSKGSPSCLSGRHKPQSFIETKNIALLQP